MVPLIKATFALIFVLLSILEVYAESEQRKHSDQSQVAEDASPGLSSFLEHVLKAQDEINWVKRVAQHEKGATKEQCVQFNSKPFPKSDTLEKFDSDSDYHLDTPVQNFEGNEWRLCSSGENLASDFMYNSDQSQFKSKNTGERFKRRSSDEVYKDPELREIVRNNIDNLHMLNFSPEQDTDIHMIAETGDIEIEDDTSIKRRGTGKADPSEETTNADETRKTDHSDSVAEAYFAAHGKRQASRGGSVSEPHSRGVRIDVTDPLSEAELLKTMNERSEREHQRLQLEDADGLLKGTRIDTHIGSIDTQMALDKEKNLKKSNKVKFRTVPIKESKITSRDSQSQDRGLPQQIKLDLLNDPLYNKVDLKTASQSVNIGNEKNEKILIAPLAAGSSALEPNLLSSVHQYLAGFDQQQQESPNRGAPELEGAQIFLNKKDTSGQQVKWDEAASTPQLMMPGQGYRDKIYVAKDSDSPVVSDIYSNVASKDMRLLRLTQSNHEPNHEISGDTSLPASKHSSCESQNQLVVTDQDTHQSSRGKRTVVKRPGAIWREVAGNEDLVGSEDEDVSQEESDAENEGKGAISFESEENDVDDSISSAGNGGPSRSSSEENVSAVDKSEETIKQANGKKPDENIDKTNNNGLDQDLENSHSNDAARLKASFEFSSKYAPHLEANSIQDAEETEETSASVNSNFVRNERAIKKTHQGVEGKSEQKENKSFAGITINDGLDQGHKTKNNHLDDAARLKASFKFSSKYAPPLEANSIQKVEDTHQTSNSDNSHFVRNGREIKKSHRGLETSAAGFERVIGSDEDAEPKLDRHVNVQKSHGLDALDSYDDVPEDTVNSNRRRIRNENLSSMVKSHSSRSLLSLFEPPNSIQDFENQINSSPSIQKLCLQGEEKVAGYSSEPLSMIIDRELLSGNLPPLVRVKRSASEAVRSSPSNKNMNSPESVIVDGMQSSLDENTVKQGAVDRKSACANMKRSMFNEKQTVHGNARRFAIEQSAKGKAALSVNVKRSEVDNKFDKQGLGYQESVRENVKRSADEADLLGEPADDADLDQEAIFEQLWNSGSVRAKRARVHSKRNHGRAHAPIARDASNKEMSGEKGGGECSHDEQSEWKISIRSTKHARRNNEDEDEKEYESDDLNMCPKNATKRATEHLDLMELDSEDRITSEMEDVNIHIPINGQADETEDESEYDYSQDKQDKDYDAVRRHVQHSFKKRHPANKDDMQDLVTNIEEKVPSDESKIENESTRNVVKQVDRDEEKEGRAIQILSEDRYKRATHYDGSDTGKVKSDLMSMSSLSSSNMGNTNHKRNSQSLVNSPADLNSPIIPDSKIINQLSPSLHTVPVNRKLSGSSTDKAVQGLAFPRSDLHEIHEMHLAGTKLSDSPAFGIDLTSSIPYSGGNLGDMTFLAPNVNERAPDQHVRCAEMASASPPSPYASVASSTKPSCLTGHPAIDGQPRSERRTDCRRGIVNTPISNQSEEYNGELDDGHLGTEIVQAIFQQVDKTPCFKQSFGSGLSLRYHPSDIKETKENNCHSQQMMHQIMQLIDQSVDEEVKSRTCSSLPSDLEEFMTWLMRNDTQPVSSTENPFFFGSQCAKAPTPRHLEEPKAEDIERQISLRNKLICEYNKLEKCDQDEVKPIYEYLSEQKNFLSRLLQKSQSKSGCDKKLECTKKPGCDSDLEQQRLVEETMDSVGLGPNAMHSSNIGDKFISGMSMIDESSEQLSDADGGSVARRSVPKDGRLRAQRSYYDRRFLPDARSSPVLSRRPVRDAEDEPSHEGFSRNFRHNSDDNEYDERLVDDVELGRSLKQSNRYKDIRNRRRSLKEGSFVPSIKYKRLVARVAELKRRKRNTSRRKKPIA